MISKNTWESFLAACAIASFQQSGVGIFALIKNVGVCSFFPPAPSSMWGSLITADTEILKVVTTVYVNLLTSLLFICFINCLVMWKSGIFKLDVSSQFLL